MEMQLITEDNFPEVVAIYKQGLATDIATFQNDLPHWKEWDKGHPSFCRTSIYEHNKMLG